MYVCGPTVYDLAHLGNARPVVVFDVVARLLRRLYPSRDLRPQHHGRGRQDQRPRPGNRRADRRHHRPHHGRFPRRHGGPGRPAAGRGTPRDRPHRRDDHDHRAPDRLRPRLCGGGPRAVRRRLRPRLRQTFRPQPGRAARRRPGRGRALQARPRRLRAVEAVRRTTCPAGTAPGAAAGPAGISNAPPCPGNIWARPSTSTAAAAT